MKIYPVKLRLAGVFAAGALLAVAYPANGAIRQAGGVSVTDVISAIALASDGDTVVIPAGTAIWTRNLTIRKAITLQGSGIGRTIIVDGVQSGPFLTWSLVAGKASRMTGIEFRNGGRRATSAAPLGVFGVAGSNTNGSTFRMDHCMWKLLNGGAVFDTVIGVVDHNIISSSQGPFFNIYGTRWDGGAWGDKSWASPTNFGSSQFLFLEDNIYWNAASYARGMTDSYGGGRFVVRHNTIRDAIINTHGTEGQRRQGVRAIEAYNNNLVGTNRGIVGNCRSGVVLFHDNTISGYGPSPSFILHCHRMFNRFPLWEGADGTNRWDDNQPGGPFFTGTASGARSGLIVTVAGNPNWRANQWMGYSVKRTTNLAGRRSADFGEILSNTANTLTYSSAGGYTSNLSFASGDSLQIWKVNHALDQPGRTGGSLLGSGNIPSPPVGWNNQVTEPCYSWNNTREGGAHVNFNSAQSVIRQNEHFFNDRAMPGYTPYTYPHPLTLLPTGAARAVIADFNGDGHPDYVLQRPSTRQTAIWYFDNNSYVGSALGPTLSFWRLAAAEDFNRDSHADYAMFSPVTGRTGIWYLSGPTYAGSAYGPTLPSGWELAAVADFNGDSKPDYLLSNGNNGQTAIYYLDNNVYAHSAYGPTLPLVWTLVGAADFNGDGKPDYLLYNVNTQQTAIYYLDNNVYAHSAYGPTLPPGWSLVAP